MTRVLDPKSVEEALHRAAHTAKHGTREERSGKFLLDANVPAKGEAGGKSAPPKPQRRVAG